MCCKCLGSGACLKPFLIACILYNFVEFVWSMVFLLSLWSPSLTKAEINLHNLAILWCPSWPRFLCFHTVGAAFLVAANVFHNFHLATLAVCSN